jgi:hypothetical protein
VIGRWATGGRATVRTTAPANNQLSGFTFNAAGNLTNTSQYVYDPRKTGDRRDVF